MPDILSQNAEYTKADLDHIILHFEYKRKNIDILSVELHAMWRDKNMCIYEYAENDANRKKQLSSMEESCPCHYYDKTTHNCIICLAHDRNYDKYVEKIECELEYGPMHLQAWSDV